MMDSIPVVAITGQVASELIGTDAFQEIDVLGMSLSCTKHSFLVSDPAELGAVIAEAFQIARSGRPGPVLIDVPKDVQLALVEPRPAMHLVDESAPLCDLALAEARRLLAAAKRPILYVGGGVELADAVDELRAFAATTGIPSVTTLKGIGTLDPAAPGFLGMLGMHGTKAANLAVQQSDLLLVVGARFDDRVTGKLSAFAAGAKVIHLDIDAAEIGKRRTADVSLQSDLKQLLPALTMPLTVSDWQQHCQALRAQNPWRYDHPGDRIYAPLLLKQLSDALPANTVVACDVGQHQMWVAQHMTFTSPRNHISSSGLGTMGFGLPAAVGAKVARPDDQVVLVSGDGSFMMNVQEMGTLRRAQLPVKMVLLDNQSLGMVRQWQ